VAVKTIKLDKFLNDNTLRDMIINEIQALKKLDDPHIIKMIKMLKSANNIYLVYEYLQGVKLCEYMQEKKKVNENEAVAIFIQNVKAFNTLQKEKICKKNLNPDNIYIHEGNIKLKNFFICKSSYS
jgi:serine/threonine-protein kinase ULK/ATG1